MDQAKIGAFIAACRREQKLTQAKLAESLGITDRAVSKWERGKSLPDASLMLELCGLLGISVNELLSGERIAMERYNQIAEENLVELKRQQEEHVKMLLTLEWVIGLICVLTFFVLLLTALLLVEATLWRVLLSLFAVAVFAVGIVFGMKLEREAGYYECPSCGARYVPDLLPFWMSMHVGRTRYLKCPRCGKRNWQRKVLSRD